MSDGYGQESHWEPLLRIKGRSFAFQEQTASDIIYQSVETMSVAGYPLDMVVVHSPGEGWHAGFLLKRAPFAFFEGNFASPEEAVDLAQAFLADAQNVQKLVRLRERVPAQQFLMIKGTPPSKRRRLKFWMEH